ncbi:MAG TPA: glycosyltransferase family 2 protein [Gemmatimonadales bacterium]|nr:glycosyltransferase family 2 protein [Gemmatimonadales bacterium]
MRVVALFLIALPAALALYAYLGYPALLRVLAAFRPAAPEPFDPAEWPSISISLPAYNEAGSIGATLESLLALDYPAERRQILVVSDASSDGTDAIVRTFADRGVELLRLPKRAGKTAAENAAAPHLRGEIVVNTDATIRILPGSLRPLIRAFQDPTVGVASGRDRSVGKLSEEGNSGESGYVGYEMWLRSLETRAGSIVGASGCFYAIRRELVDLLFPAALSRDFAAPLRARERGFRTVSVDAAVCLVPRTTSLRSELRRKVRTMARGLDTLWYKRSLLNPVRYGWFSWMLASHKLCRWLVHLTLPGAFIGLALSSPGSLVASVLLFISAVVSALGIYALAWPSGRPVPRAFAICGYVVAVNVAGLAAWMQALRREQNPIWEPTRRPGDVAAAPAGAEGS